MPSQKRAKAEDPLLRQVLAFGVTGALATFTHTISAFVCIEAFATPPLLGNFAGFAMGFSLSLLGNFYLVFKFDGRIRDILPKFLVSSFLGLALSTSEIQIALLLSLPTFWALVAITLTVPIFSFAVNKLWVFHTGHSPH